MHRNVLEKYTIIRKQESVCPHACMHVHAYIHTRIYTHTLTRMHVHMKIFTV